MLIDDGLDRNTVQPYEWHDRLTPFSCRRIVRIEVLAQDILVAVREEGVASAGTVAFERFSNAVKAALKDPLVAGFKSVICYRTGLAVLDYEMLDFRKLATIAGFSDIGALKRLKDEALCAAFVHLTCRAISESDTKKPFQFHCGLGDNDLKLTTASAAHMQELVKYWSKVPFVLLHASYPFTQEAGYLASVYENCYLDIGEVFPMVSKEGQEKVIREALELCPTNKLCWSTDGHWFPEVCEPSNGYRRAAKLWQTYLLAVIQIREGLEKASIHSLQASAS